MTFKIDFSKQEEISFETFELYLTGEKVLSVEEDYPNTIIELEEIYLIIECFGCQGDDCSSYKEQRK